MARMLGWRPADPERLANAKRMARFLETSTLPTHPESVDYMTRIPQWLLGRNTSVGSCGPTSVANFVLLVTTILAEWPLAFTDDEIIDLYSRVSGYDPATGANDNGVDMTELLSELVRNGIGFDKRNVKAIAYAALPDPHDVDMLWSASARFGGVLCGADLAQAQDQQTNAGLWDYVPRSGAWGGHAFLTSPRYSDKPGTTEDRTGLVTWAEPIDLTDAFYAKQNAETYVVILPWHLQDKGFLENTDLVTLAADFTTITGKPFPIKVPPKPVDPPVDPPVTQDATAMLTSIRDQINTFLDG